MQLEQEAPAQAAGGGGQDQGSNDKWVMLGRGTGASMAWRQRKE